MVENRFVDFGALLTKHAYQSYYNDLTSQMVRGAVAEVNALATGTITVSLCKGAVTHVKTVDVPHSLYINIKTGQ